jgi:hypothetical protein
MPYQVYASGNQFCVHKKNPDGSKGKKIGCDPSKAKAQAQMRALYAAEDKELNMADETITANEDETITVAESRPDVVDKLKEMDADEAIDKGYVPYPITSFSDLDEAREAREIADKTFDLADDFVGLVRNIMWDSEIVNKGVAVSAAADELQSRLDNVNKDVKEVGGDDNDDPEQRIADKVIATFKGYFDNLFKGEEEKEKSSEFMVWKEKDGSVRWLAIYSNNFRDEDRPVKEIISEVSHINFVDLVDTKQVDPPELWLWHVPEWKLGVADLVAWDDAGFAVAAGHIDQGKESVAEWISEQKDVAVSHGMPNDSIMRDPDDQSIIIRHITKEISPLPNWAAANKRTGFVTFDGNTIHSGKEEFDMTIPKDKKDKLVSDWGANPSLIDELEQMNVAEADKAAADGVESKEAKDDDTTEGATTEEVDTEGDAKPTETEPEAGETQEETSDTSDFPTREEVAEVLVPIAQQVNTLTESINELSKQIGGLLKDDKEKVKDTVDSTTKASLAALVAQGSSAIGSDEAEIDGSSNLAKDGPQQADGEPITGITFLDKILEQGSEN